MSSSPRTNQRAARSRPTRGATVGLCAQLANAYLTDGLELYRWLGEVAGEPIPLVGLEDCRTLDVVLMSVSDFEARDLRLVVPIGEL